MSMVNKKTRNLSPEVRYARKLHGKYISLIKNMSVEERAKLSVIRKEKGVEEAIKAARLVGSGNNVN